MADDDYADDGFYFGDDDYLYVEDAFAIADELAENQIPSPGYAGTNNELEYETYEYDIYEYFGELEYADDTYWDSNITHLGGSETLSKAGSKRKGERAVGQTAKRRKVAARQDEGEGEDNVIYKSFKQRLPPAPLALERRTSFALLPDWKERFRDEGEGVVGQKDMPADMRRAAEGKGEEGSPVKRRKGQAVEMLDEEEGEDWEDEDEEGEDEGDEGGLGGIDADTLRAILKQKLSETGVDLEGEALDQMIAQLLSGSSEDAAGSLASLLLGQAQEGEDSTASKWLSQQGVHLEDQDGATDEATTPASSHAIAPQISPSDSAVGTAASTRSSAPKSASEAQQATNTAAVLTNSQPPTTTAATLTNRKRKASDENDSTQEPGQDQSTKRRQPSHALPQQPQPPPEAARRTRRAVSTRHEK